MVLFAVGTTVTLPQLITSLKKETTAVQKFYLHPYIKNNAMGSLIAVMFERMHSSVTLERETATWTMIVKARSIRLPPFCPIVETHFCIGNLWCAHNSCFLNDDRSDIGKDCCMDSNYTCIGQDGCCLDKKDSNLLVRTI